jgi:hypothetical protein
MNQTECIDFLRPENRAHGKAAVVALIQTVKTNEARAACGHPPVPCQLTGEQTAAVAAMVGGLEMLLQSVARKGGQR